MRPGLQVSSRKGLLCLYQVPRASLAAQGVKTLPSMWIQSLDREDPLENGMSTHSSILACRTPWTEEPGGLYRWGCKDLNMTNTHTCTRYPRLSKFGITLICVEDQRFLEPPEWCRPGLLDCAKADLSTYHTLESNFFLWGEFTIESLLYRRQGFDFSSC